MSFLLDTCVVSELFAKRPNERVVAWVDARDPAAAYLSVITIGEIQKGIALLPDSRRKDALAAWLQDALLVRFADRVIPLDTPVLRAWGQLVGNLERRGTPMAVMDSLVAAGALHHKLQLATRNVSDFRHSGVEIVNPWGA